MWSTDAANSLIKKATKSNDDLTKELAKYLGFALNTIEYLENRIESLNGRVKELEAK